MEDEYPSDTTTRITSVRRDGGKGGGAGVYDTLVSRDVGGWWYVLTEPVKLGVGSAWALLTPRGNQQLKRARMDGLLVTVDVLGWAMMMARWDH